MTSGTWSWASSKGDGENNDEVVLTLKATSDADGAAVACMAAGVGEAVYANDAARIAAGAGFGVLACKGDAGERLRRATDAANEAIRSLKKDAEAVNSGAAVTAAIVGPEALRCRVVGNGLVLHWRASDKELERCNRPRYAANSTRPGAAVMGMPYDGETTSEPGKRLEAGDVVIIGSAPLARVPEVEMKRILDDASRSQAGIAPKVLAAIIKQRSPRGDDATVACYQVPHRSQPDTSEDGRTIAGNRAADEVRIGGKLLNPNQKHAGLELSDSFSWGYEGPAPEHLATAILASAGKKTPNETVRYLRTRFMTERIATLHTQEWEWTEKEVTDWIAGQRFTATRSGEKTEVRFRDKIVDVAHSRRRVKKAETFDWGKQSAGSDQLAAAMLLEVTRSPFRTKELYEQYARERLVTEESDSWTIETVEINAWVEATTAARAETDQPDAEA